MSARRFYLLSYLELSLQKEAERGGASFTVGVRCHTEEVVVILCSERCLRGVGGSYRHHHQSHASSAKKNSRLYQDLDDYSYSSARQILQRNSGGNLSCQTPHRASGKIHNPQVSWAVACANADPRHLWCRPEAGRWAELES